MRLILNRSYFLVMLAPLLWGCGDSLSEAVYYEEQAIVGNEVCSESAGTQVPVHISLEGFQSQSVRTIAPSHISPAALGTAADYRLVMDCSSDMGERKSINNFSLSNGTGILTLSPGAWTLHLTVMDRRQADKQVLSGTGFVVVQDAPTSASITLHPITGTGTVSVEFTLPQSVVKRLDPSTSPTKTIAMVLLDATGQEVVSTREVVQVNANNGVNVLTYTANGSQVASGRYTMQLTSSYTINNSSTNRQPVTYTMAWSDVLYVEGNRQSSSRITIPAGISGNPGNPYRQDKVNLGGSSATVNFVTSTTFNPWGETLWLFGENWDGNGSDLNGNEILVVSWTPVYDADYYELELLVHPFTNSVTPANRYGRFNKVVTTDAEWDALRLQSFTASGQNRGAFYMRFSGGTGDPDYYKARTYTINCANGTTSVVNNFVSCADKTLARRLFATGTQNFSYRIAPATDVFDSYGTFSYNGVPMGKVGLEGDCGVLGVLVPSFSPQMSLVYRVRAVNRFGYSDWVYWKGGKW